MKINPATGFIFNSDLIKNHKGLTLSVSFNQRLASSMS